MLLVDTSVWIAHLRATNRRLADALDAGVVLSHPFVTGELACGSLRRRDAFLLHLAHLPAAAVATHEEVLHMIQRHRLHGRGLGWIDAHLLASAMLSDADLYTTDRALLEAWRRLT